MTKIIIQHFVENLLKVLKVLKTRTALTRNKLSELRIRYARKGAKALSNQRSKPGYKRKLQIYYKTAKSLKSLLTYDIMKSEKKEAIKMKHNYELRELNSDATTTIVLRMTEEPREAKKRAKAYAEENPGLYSLKRIETVEVYFTEVDRND